MNVKGVGSYSEFTYNYETGKISTESQDEEDLLFVKYFNGEFDTDGDHLPEGLTGFDYRKRGEILSMAESLMRNGYWKNHPEEYDGDIVLGIRIEDAATWYITSPEISTLNCLSGGIRYTKEEMAYERGEVDFNTKLSLPYNAKNNSITIGIGASYELLDGYTFKIETNKVSFHRMPGKGDDLTDQEAGMICQYLEAFLRFADQQWGSKSIYSMYNGNDYNRIIKKFLEKLGVDISKEFTVNETKCVFQDNQFVDAEYDNENGMVGARGVYQQALNRYEQQLYAPLTHDSFYQKSV